MDFQSVFFRTDWKSILRQSAIRFLCSLSYTTTTAIEIGSRLKFIVGEIEFAMPFSVLSILRNL